MFGLGMSLVQNYSSVDKLLHYLAFSSPFVQRILCDIENNFYEKDLLNTSSANEVFVTGLPRSGTTLLLELLYKTNEFSTFSYRQMPFILSPLFWNKISKQFSKKALKVQRSHNDGMEVSFDSPEAFEEVIWLNYLKNQFVKQDKLEPITAAAVTKEFARSFQLIIKKLLLITANNGVNMRYLSKNNANCSRIKVLTQLYPTAKILVPFRNPLAHIGSLKKQHQQFNQLHREDKFATNYMLWLGHYDFGVNFKPINFDAWLNSYDGKPDYDDDNFWIQYWCSAYNHILNNMADHVFLIDYDKLLSQPTSSLSGIASTLELNHKDDFVSLASDIRSPTSKAIKSDKIKTKHLEEAEILYTKLQNTAL